MPIVERPGNEHFARLRSNQFQSDGLQRACHRFGRAFYSHKVVFPFGFAVSPARSEYRIELRASRKQRCGGFSYSVSLSLIRAIASVTLDHLLLKAHRLLRCGHLFTLHKSQSANFKVCCLTKICRKNFARYFQRLLDNGRASSSCNYVSARLLLNLR